MDGHVLKSLELENHIFSSWCVCVCLSVISIKNRNRNFKFGILHLYHMHMLLETLYKDRINNLCTRVHKRTLIHYGLWGKFFVVNFLYI